MNKVRWLQDIIDRRSRSDDTNRFKALKKRLDSIIGAYTAISSTDSSDELFRYIPIALVACMEGYFKRLVQDFIDFKEEYRNRLTDFKLKFDMEELLAIHGRTVTLGEFVAETLTISRLDQAIGFIEKLIGEPFLDRVLKEESELLSPDKVLPPETMHHVAETFRLRHIYCHEMSAGPRLDAAMTFVLLVDVVRFLHVIEQYAYKLTGPDPDTKRHLLAAALMEHE